MTSLELIATRVHHFEVHDLDDDGRAALRLHAADAGMALFAGAGSPEGLHLIGLSPSGAVERAALAAAIIRCTEVDDIHLQSCVTPTSIAFPAAVLTSPQALCGARQAENALLVGLELAVRLGLAIDGATALYRGIWPTCFVAPFAVAGALARLRKLTLKQTVNALSLALMMASGRSGRFVGEPSGRWVLLMAAFEDGARAVKAAEHGLQGDPALLDGPWLKNTVGAASEIAPVFSGAGSALDGLGMKPFSTARQALAATQALLELVREGLDPRNIKTIDVRVPESYAAMISRPLEPHRSSGFVHAGFQMALAALKPEGLFDLDRSQIMGNEALLAFASKVRVVGDSALQGLFPAQWPAEIIVRTVDGLITRRIESPRGDACNRLSREEVRAKAHRLLAGKMPADEVETSFNVLLDAFTSDQAYAAAAHRMMRVFA